MSITSAQLYLITAFKKPEELPDRATEAQVAEFNKKSQSVLVMSITSAQLYLITAFEKPADAWVALRNHFERDTFVNKLIQKERYFRMEMKEGTPVESHIKAMKKLTDKLAAIKAPIAEEDQVVTLLDSLPSSFSNLVTALEARDTVSLSYVQQSLIHEEQQLKGDRSSSMTTRSGQAVAADEKQEKSKKACYLCGELGHFQRNCPKGHNKRRSWKPKHKAKTAREESSESEKAFGSTTSQSHNSGSWIIDSGASSHMTHDKELLVNYEEFKEPQKRSLGDGQTVKAYGKGDTHFAMAFKMSDSKEIKMCNALLCSRSGLQLVFCQSNNCKGEFSEVRRNKMQDSKQERYHAGNGAFRDKLYYLDCRTTTQDQIANASKCQTGSPEADLWPQCLGHLNEHQLKEMICQKLVTGMKFPKYVKVSFCKKCVKGKMA